jgi:hypothetical protein
MARPAKLLGLGLTSAAWLAFEIGLTRLFAIQQFHHFAFLVVSLAVLASAASGLLLTLQPRTPSLALLSVAFGGSIPLAYLTINFLPFDSYSLTWDARQMVVLIVYFVAAGLPFLFAGWIAGACLTHAGVDVHLAYAANLGGAAVGSLGGLAALEVMSPESLLAATAAAALAAAAAFENRHRRWALITLSALALLGSSKLPDVMPLRLSPYKPLASARLALDARTALTEWSASARLDVVESPSIHILPGLSLNAASDLPDQVALFVDGDGPLPITSLAPDGPLALDLAASMPATLAYSLRPSARALILDPGAGLDVVLALASGARTVTLPTDDPRIVAILEGTYAEFTHHLLEDPRIQFQSRTTRGLLRALLPGYDVVQFALSDPYHPVSSGAFTLTEDYTLTVEAVSEAFGLLDPNGLLVLTRWLQTPPSETGRALTLLLAVLEANGIGNPAEHLIGYRSMRTASFLAARRPFTPEELTLTRRFLEANGFDPILLPDLAPAELNRFNRLPVDTYADLAASLVQGSEQVVDTYDFDLRPPTDDHPFFFHFFRWRQTPALLQRLGQTWQPFGGSGYLVLLALLLLVTAFAIPLALGPLVLLRRRTPPAVRGKSASRIPIAILPFFACIGAGFMLVEIPLIQRLTHLLDRPPISLGAVLFTLLLASGLGSLYLAPRMGLPRSLTALSLAIAALCLALPHAIRWASPLPLPGRLAIAVLVLVLPGMLMGVPFAAGLRRLATRPELVPWAWATNGAASGISGVLAAITALAWGITPTLLLGALAYAAAALASRRL